MQGTGARGCAARHGGCGHGHGGLSFTEASWPAGGRQRPGPQVAGGTAQSEAAGGPHRRRWDVGRSRNRLCPAEGRQVTPKLRDASRATALLWVEAGR